MNPSNENTPLAETERPEDRQLEANLLRTVSGPGWKVDRRLAELDGEWSLERVLTLLLALLMAAGIGLAAAFGTNWLWLGGIAAGLLILSVVTAWQPGVALCRSFGLRCQNEIDRERYALKALRGDFQTLSGIITPHDREELARFEGEGGAVSYWTAPDASDPEVVREALQAVER